MARTVLEIQTGELAGHRTVVGPGEQVRVGRARPAELVVPDDPLLSGLHFVVECDEQGCRVRDLGSRFGTFCGGQQLTAADLRNGDEILAGRTRVLVTVTDAAVIPANPVTVDGTGKPVTAEPVRETVSAPATPPSPPPALPPERTAVLAWLADQTPLYAILDSAREPTIPDRLARSGEEHQSLFEGDMGKLIAPFGPWLVRLGRGSRLLSELIGEGWGQSWGVYLACERPLAEVRRHLRQLLTVKLPDGRKVLFRFYDPRVLRPYLPNCTADELRTFFGPIWGYFAEGGDGAGIQEFTSAVAKWRPVAVAAGAR